ncbi:hypothetical protein [Mucilaginibacter sp.]|uniref:hypothetical protein n=1 Tax=Mucilaginibacter sp. TaxID=1882438 RepID=UPI00284CD642|nr:hypothetical protein [Mucilaginibacter sp.]MDR3693090.1 hypothetical protein [Mucilaginibacter sp.]
MKIQQLFDELEKIKVSTKSDFEKSGMVNRFDEMKYGFFPLGLGILTENNKIKDTSPTNEIEEGGIMVLGNDFGTVTYVEKVKKYSEGIGETKSKPNATSIERLYLNGDFVVEKELDKPTFVVVAHPCYLGNLKIEYVEKLNTVLKSNVGSL